MNLEEFFNEVYTISHFEENEAALFNEIYNLSHIQEISSTQFADTLRKYVFNKTSKESDNAGLNAMDKMVNQLHNTKYQRTDVQGKLKINGDVENILRVKETPNTHLQLNNGDYCNKADFQKEFSQEKWQELPEKFKAGNTPKILCDRYLTGYTDDGWIDSKVDTLEDKIRKN